VSPRHALRRFRQAVAAPDAQRVPRLLLAFEPEALAALCSGPLPSTADLLGRPEEGFGQGGEPLDRALRWYALRYLPDYILAKVDRCSMRHGLEVRSPFLDTAVVEFAAGLPASFKMPGARRKWFMKQALGRHMPGIVRRRGKRGFLMPVAGWLAGSLRGLLRDMASPARLERQGLFRPEAVARLLREHEEGSVDRREELWTFLVLQIWLESRGL
jgi:asparagine synthase (glutamine-hydrolysing)